MIRMLCDTCYSMSTRIQIFLFQKLEKGNSIENYRYIDFVRNQSESHGVKLLQQFQKPLKPERIQTNEWKMKKVKSLACVQDEF